MANGNPTRSGRTSARTLFLSDTHLGFRHARVHELNEFLHGVEAERIVLVGDIVDALSLARPPFWTAEHTQVVRTLLARQRAGARLIYIPGNHDASLAMLAQMLQGQFEVHREWVHRTARGERLLVLHGDQLDGVVPCPRWLTRLGDVLHDATVMVSHRVNNLRRALGKPYWPLAERIKLSIGTSVRYIEHFEQLAAQHARAQGYDGVVTTLRCTAETLTALGHEVRVISPQGLSCIACPSYPEIRLALSPGTHVARQLKAFRPHAIHIATEGPLGLAVRRYCRGRGVPFTTSYHTRYPQYLRARWPIPLAATYAWLKRFHGAATRTFVSSATLEVELSGRGFARLHRWHRGVDLRRFRPLPPHPQLAHLPRPIMACVGRLAVEKNLDAFLRLNLPGTKVMIGDGPERHALSGRFPGTLFTGYRFGEELARCLATADVLVFPSLTDTFGLAMIEALACGVPVAAFPVPGPLDVIEQDVTGVLRQDLSEAIRSALRLERRVCVERAAGFSWHAATAQFLAGLAPIPLALRATLAVSRSSAIIARIAARRQTSEAGDAN